jgi:hypothetical protein
VFDKPPAMLQITPNLGWRGQTGIAVTKGCFDDVDLDCVVSSSK